MGSRDLARMAGRRRAEVRLFCAPQGPAPIIIAPALVGKGTSGSKTRTRRHGSWWSRKGSRPVDAVPGLAPKRPGSPSRGDVSSRLQVLKRGRIRNAGFS